MARKHLDNIDFITHLCTYSKHGALAQMFVLDAIAKVAERVASLPVEQVEEMMQGHLISGRAWHGVAVEIRDAIKERDNG